MSSRRHGRRDATRAWLIALACIWGCGTGSAPIPASIPGPTATRARPPTVLDPPPSASAVSEIAWGGSDAPDVVAVRFADGRFAVHRPGARRLDSDPEAPPALAIAVLGPGRTATGDAAGVVLWDTSRGPPRVIGRSDCGGVRSLIATGGDGRDPSLIAGCSDGRLVRLRIARGDRIEVIAVAKPEGPSAVIRLDSIAGHAGFVAITADGSARSCSPDLAGRPVPLGPSRAVASTPGGPFEARLRDGPRVEVTDPGGSLARGRFLPPRPVNSLALLRPGSTLAIGVDRSLWIAAVETDGSILPSRVRVVDGLSGAVVVAADPGGKRLAVGDGSGRVELIDAADLLARGEPMSLDNAPEWAFRPALRFNRPRSGRVDPRIEAARRKLDRGENAASALRSIEADATLDRAGLAEVRALSASAESRGSRPPADLPRKLGEAAAPFSRSGSPDREADLRFWRGMALARPIEGAAGGRDPQASHEAIGEFRRAATLYRAAVPPLDRQAQFCDAARAWALLDLGDVSGASRAMAPVIDAARADPVLGRVVELDRVAAAIFAARRDWARSAASDGLLLKRLPPGERPELARDAALSRAGALAAIGDWPDAADTLRDDRPSDAEWTIRRAACRERAHLEATPRPPDSEDDPVSAHLRALLGRGDLAERLADLAIAARGHRLADRDDLALEAELARAESLERAGKLDEATAAHAAVARSIAALGVDLPRRASRPILDARLRAARGLARCEVAAGRPLRALAALEAGDAPVWSTEPGGALGLAASEFPLAESLRDARARLEKLGGPGAGDEADSATLELHRAGTQLAGQVRAPRPGDRASAADASSFGLADDEAILAFARIGPRSMVGIFVPGSGKPEARVLAIGPDDLAREVAAWRASRGEGGRPIVAGARTSPASILGLPDEPDPPAVPAPPAARGPAEARLHDALIGPFAAKLEPIKRLHVVPGEDLAAMPLEVLGRGGRVGDRLSLRLLPRASMLPLARDESRIDRPSERLALLISPEEGSPDRSWASEVRASGWTPRGLTGGEARPDRVLGESLSGYGVVHVRSGAVLDPSRSRSGGAEIALRPGAWINFAEGLLSSRDLAHVPLRARVLVLEVRDPRGATAEGLRELSRAGLSTGAEGVLISLWAHPQTSSRRFFAAFYAAIGGGKSPAEAASEARSAVARDPEFRDPVHWAGYAYYGP